MIDKLQKFMILCIFCLTGVLVWRLCGDSILERIQRQTEGKETSLLSEPDEPDAQEEYTSVVTEKEGQETEAEDEMTRILPSFYDAREAGKGATVKNQGNLGTCWAVTASSALEASLLPEERICFSPDHISMKNAYGRTVEEGGFYSMVVSYLVGWLGPVTEEEDSYGDGYSPEDLSPVRHVQEVQMLDEKDLSAIKELVYTYGAVQSSLYMDMESQSHSSVYYNEFESAYCYAGDEEPNHDVLIIGWDDDYPKGNFSVNVKENGAFLCQNSWGENFGENGIFYVSYEDERIGTSSVAYTRIEPTDNYDHIYQSDLCGWVGQMGYEQEDCYFANVYEADGSEELSAVGFYATGKDTSYEVFVAENFSSSFSLIGKKAVAKGTFQNPGYYTVELNDPVELSGGQSFAVLVKIHTPESLYPVATEYVADDNSRNVVVDDGEGYLSPNGLTWKNTEDNYDCNVCLKAYTTDCRDE